jgi:hypothetical protein
MHEIRSSQQLPQPEPGDAGAQIARLLANLEAALRELNTPPDPHFGRRRGAAARDHRGSRVRVLQTALLDQLCQPRAAHPDPVLINVTIAVAAGAAAYQ